jgi:hypothetical protein
MISKGKEFVANAISRTAFLKVAVMAVFPQGPVIWLVSPDRSGYFNFPHQGDEVLPNAQWQANYLFRRVPGEHHGPLPILHMIPINSIKSSILPHRRDACSTKRQKRGGLITRPYTFTAIRIRTLDFQPGIGEQDLTHDDPGGLGVVL